MSEPLERAPGRRPSLMILVAMTGLGVAALAYMTAPTHSSSSEAPGRARDEKIRVPMFIDPDSVQPTPRFRFTFDPPEVLAGLRAEEDLDAVIAGAGSDLDRAVQLMRWTRAQWEPGIPSPYPPINARIILRDIRREFTGGFCAQYNYVLVQSLQSFGIPARYVSVVEHEVIEARLPDLGRWVALDPLYDTYYTDDTGRPLSALEIHGSTRDGLPVMLSNENLVADIPSHLGAFRSLAFWLKNDHVSSPLNFTDLERYKVYFVDQTSEADLIPFGALTTSEPVDIYPG